jgi:hypothetical protein
MREFNLVNKYIGVPALDIPIHEREEGMVDLIHRLIARQDKKLIPWNVGWCLSRSTLQPKERFAAVVYCGFRLGYLKVEEIDYEGEKTLGIGITVKGIEFYNS